MIKCYGSDKTEQRGILPVCPVFNRPLTPTRGRTRVRPNLEGPANAGGYSDRKLFTGFDNAALIAWKLTVNKAMATDRTAASAKTFQLISTR